MSLVLIVDDIEGMRDQYSYDLDRLGRYETLTASSGEEAFEVLDRNSVDCVLLDLEMPGMDGFEVLKEMRKRGYRQPVLVYTGTGSYDRCVRAVRLGAYTFIDKAESMEKVAREIENALEHRRLVSEVKDLRDQLGETGSLVGRSRAIQKLREEITRVAPIPSPVLILGESGTGKELVAREIHEQSGRGRQPFLAINCAALPENLVESELFGHEAGAFTGAGRPRKGAFEAAARGTLLLDEVGELPGPVQAKLLRVLEESAVTRLGGNREMKVESRVLTATNRDLETEVAEGRFREDLLFRINVHQVLVPPLRERLSDVPVLVEHFLESMCTRFGTGRKTLSPGAMARLEKYAWKKNNVRELRNVVERMIIASDGAEIGIEHVPESVQTGSPGEGKRGMKELKADAEKDIVLAALDRNDWHITRTAADLGLADHSSLLKIMKRHGLKK